MGFKPLTAGQLSKYNLRSNPFRTAGLVMIAAVLSFTMFGGAVLSQSLENGLSSLKARLGADLAVVPLEHESDYEGIILSGEPGRFYFDQSMEQEISKIQGVDRVSSQFFLSTLTADCCAVPVQIIGFDPDTDFVINPWITKVYDEKIGKGELIVGSDIVVNRSGTLMFFNETYTVAAQLEKTSTGMDHSVYAGMDTMKALLEGARSTGMNLSADVYRGDMEHSISTVLVKINRNYDADAVTTNIRRQVSGISVVKSKSVFSSIAGQIAVLLTFISTVTYALWLLAVLILSVMFSVIINSRKKEFAILRSLGATRKKLGGMVLMEALYISALGGTAGISLTAVTVFPFSTYIGGLLGLPYLPPDGAAVIRLMIVSFLLSLTAGPAAAVYSAARISRLEAYVLLREGE
ncbi:ABC transporter permease [Lachnospiraceae bacterium 54-53]